LAALAQDVKGAGARADAACVGMDSAYIRQVQQLENESTDIYDVSGSLSTGQPASCFVTMAGRPVPINDPSQGVRGCTPAEVRLQFERVRDLVPEAFTTPTPNVAMLVKAAGTRATIRDSMQDATRKCMAAKQDALHATVLYRNRILEEEAKLLQKKGKS
jgi:hypothetical protein